MARRAVARSLWLRSRPRQWVQFNNATSASARCASTGCGRRVKQRGGTRSSDGCRDRTDTVRTRRAARDTRQSSAAPLPTDGVFVVQDEASQLVPTRRRRRNRASACSTCAPRPAERPMLMAATCATRCRSSRATSGRAALALLRDTVRRPACDMPSVVHVPTDGPLPFAARFDRSPCRRARALASARCGATPTSAGVGAKTISLRSPRDQLDLARARRGSVRPGGRLVYATCSSEPEENEMVVAAFSRPERFRLVDLDVRARAAACAGSSISAGSSDAAAGAWSRGLLRGAVIGKPTKTYAATSRASERSWYDIECSMPSRFPRLEPWQVPAAGLRALGGTFLLFFGVADARRAARARGARCPHSSARP